MSVLLVDGNNLAMRSIHAMARTGLTSEDGVQTGPTYGFINALARHVKEEQPDKIVVCWDGGRSEFRVQLDPQYKAHRLAMSPDAEEDKHSTFAMCKEFLTRAGIFHIERPGVEADDLIAYYWRNHRPLDEKIVIVSNDKDFLQLLSPGIEQVRLSSSNTPTDRWTWDRVEREIGCAPQNLSYAMALAGDASDNVIGVPRFGMKTAVKTLAKYGFDWDATLLDERIAPHADRARLNFRLVDLCLGLPGMTLPTLPPFTPTSVGSIAWGALVEWLSTYQMKNVQSRLYDNTLWRA